MNTIGLALLVGEIARLDEEIKRLKETKARLCENFPIGRTEGLEFDLVKTAGYITSNYSAALLKQYVTAETLNLCRVDSKRSSSTKIKPKLKEKRKGKAREMLRCRQEGIILNTHLCQHQNPDC